MAENIYELFPLVSSSHILPSAVCVWYRINLYGKGWREEEAVKGLGIHQVPGILVVLSLGVPCPQACLLRSEGNPFCYAEEVFGERALHANTEGINIPVTLISFLSPTLTRAESSTPTVPWPGCHRRKR